VTVGESPSWRLECFVFPPSPPPFAPPFPLPSVACPILPIPLSSPTFPPPPPSFPFRLHAFRANFVLRRPPSFPPSHPSSPPSPLAPSTLGGRMKPRRTCTTPPGAACRSEVPVFPATRSPFPPSLPLSLPPSLPPSLVTPRLPILLFSRFPDRSLSPLSSVKQLPSPTPQLPLPPSLPPRCTTWRPSLRPTTRPLPRTRATRPRRRRRRR